jgi:carboxyl-terminal processing protease
MTQRMRNRLTIEFIILAGLLGVTFGYYIPEVIANRSRAYDFVGTLGDIRGELVKYYVDLPDESALEQGAIQGMLESLNDPYTTYFTAEQLKGFEKHTRGTFSGIGAEIDKEGDYIKIVAPLEDSPAFKAGIVAGDVIIAVDGESIKGASSEEAIKRITGPKGTDVKLTIRHADGKEEDFTITRGRITIQTVKGVIRDDAGKWDHVLDPVDQIGYIRMTQFSEPTAKAMVKAITELKAEGMKGLILDLRYNPGGLLDSAIQIADMFLNEGVIVSTKGRRSPERSWKAQDGGVMTDLPLLILINEGSASASEILAGALKYNKRAVVLGTRSVGKGSVQQIIPLDRRRGRHQAHHLAVLHAQRPEHSPAQGMPSDGASTPVGWFLRGDHARRSARHA